jgi:DNA-binding protein HU-beta
MGEFPLLGKEAPLNRKELVDSIQKHTSVARADVDKVLGSLIQHTQVAVKKGERVALVGFGTFERQDRKARTARNPRSGAPVKVKATKVPRFRAGQGFKDVVAGKAAAPKLTPVKSTAKASTAKASTAKSGVSRASTAKATTARASTAKASTARAAVSRNSAAKSTAKSGSKSKAKSGKKK